MTTQHRQLILSGGIHHAFNQTSALLSPLGEQHGLATSIVVHPNAAFEALEEASVQLFVVNALFWEMEGSKYDEFRADWQFCVSLEQAACLDRFVARGGKLLGLHTASICFSDLPAWSRYLGGHWRWPESYHPPIEALSVNPTPAGEALGLTAFEIEDELYCSLHRDADALPLMTARNADGAEEVVVWRKEHGEARSAYSALGHDVTSVSQQISSGLLPTLYEWLLGGVSGAV